MNAPLQKSLLPLAAEGSGGGSDSRLAMEEARETSPPASSAVPSPQTTEIRRARRGHASSPSLLSLSEQLSANFGGGEGSFSAAPSPPRAAVGAQVGAVDAEGALSTSSYAASPPQATTGVEAAIGASPSSSPSMTSFVNVTKAMHTSAEGSSAEEKSSQFATPSNACEGAQPPSRIVCSPPPSSSSSASAPAAPSSDGNISSRKGTIVGDDGGHSYSHQSSPSSPSPLQRRGTALNAANSGGSGSAGVHDDDDAEESSSDADRLSAAGLTRERERSLFGGGTSGYRHEGSVAELSMTLDDDVGSLVSAHSGAWGGLSPQHRQHRGRSLNDPSSLSPSPSSPPPTGAAVEDLNSSHYTRLVRFYERYNAEKIGRAEEFLAAYKGAEEELFAALVSKYGPEPEAPAAAQQRERRSGGGNNGGGGVASDFHFVGPHAAQLPDKVSPHDGRTEAPTPYWPVCRGVTDRDVLELFVKQRTDNAELRKCFVGFLAAHPRHAWNGMAYLSSCPLPTDVTAPFLGHTWSGTLANNKTLLYKRDYFRRTVLHCTPECQRCPLPPPAPMAAKRGSDLGIANASTTNSAAAPTCTADGRASSPPTPPPQQHHPGGERGHGRWRLVIYHVESCPYALFRAMYDPVLEAPPPALRIAHSTEGPAPQTATDASCGHGKSNSPIVDASTAPPSPGPAQSSAAGAVPVGWEQVPASDLPPTSAGSSPSPATNAAPPPKKSNFFTFSFSRKSKGAPKETAASPGAPSAVATSQPQPQPQPQPRPSSAIISAHPSPSHPSHSLGTLGSGGDGASREPLIVDSTLRSVRRDAALPPEAFRRGGGYPNSVGSSSSRSSSAASSAFGRPNIPPRRLASPARGAGGATYAQPSQPMPVALASSSSPQAGGAASSPHDRVPSYGEAVRSGGGGGAASESGSGAHHSSLTAAATTAAIAAMLAGLEQRLVAKIDTVAARVGGLERAVGELQRQQQQQSAEGGGEK